MKDSWFNHNTDKILLFVLVILAGVIVLHVVHHQPMDESALSWAENAFSTALGALILLLTGRIPKPNQNGGTNGVPSIITETAPIPGAPLPTYPKQ